MHRADFGRQTRIFMRCESYINACRFCVSLFTISACVSYTPPLLANITPSKVAGCRSHCHTLYSNNDETTINLSKDFIHSFLLSDQHLKRLVYYSLFMMLV